MLQSEYKHSPPDGPALRSTTLITYANWLLSNGNSTFVINSLWPVIKLDLDYVATYWNQSTSVRRLNQCLLLAHISSDLISGRKYTRLPSSLRRYNREHSVKAQH